MIQQRILYWILGLVLFVVALESITEKPIPPVQIVQPQASCKGEAIIVDYPYQGGYLDPWECKVQCEDGKQRYILYTNAIATPCSDVPKCLDEGEDNGRTCIPPPLSPSKTL